MFNQEKKNSPEQQKKFLKKRALIYVGKYRVTKQRLRLYLERTIKKYSLSNVQDIEIIINEFLYNKYIDDNSYGKDLINRFMQQSYYSIRATRYKLRFKGMEEALINQQMQEFQEEYPSVEWENLQYILNAWVKKHPYPADDKKRSMQWKQKLGAHLNMKGFPHSLIFQALNSMDQFFNDMENMD